MLCSVQHPSQVRWHLYLLNKKTYIYIVRKFQYILVIPLFCFFLKSVSSADKGGTSIQGLFWPPLEQKNPENCFSPISFDCYIRRITEV